MIELDHLVVVAGSLAQGVRWCEETLGVTPGPGGRHPLMATHNRLLRLGGEGFPLAYLEIVAIDPDAAPPGRARWFGMDDPSLQASVREAPRLVQLVARTTHIEMLRWGLINLGIDPGPPLAAQRETPQGMLSWRILVRDDGAIACDGALPTLIEWQGSHPADAMPASPLVLKAAFTAALPERVRELLKPRGLAIGTGPSPVVEIETARGLVRLQG